MSAPDPLPQAVVVGDEKLQAADSSRSASGDEAKAPDAVLQPPTPKKNWHQRLNPLRWQTPPPVPEERTHSREYEASFFSVITFQWMSPLMRVRYPLILARGPDSRGVSVDEEENI
jgi:hypothetical protein